ATWGLTSAAGSANASTQVSLKRRSPSTESSKPHCCSRYGCGSIPTHNLPRTCPAATRRSPKPNGWLLVCWTMLKLLECTNLEITLAQCFECLNARGYTLHGGDLWDINLKCRTSDFVAIKARTGGGIRRIDNQVNLAVQNQVHDRATFGTVANLRGLLHGLTRNAIAAQDRCSTGGGEDLVSHIG